MSTPNWNAWLAHAWGGGVDECDIPFASGASNVVVGTNPAFTIQDFLALYPKFGGTPTVLSGSTTTQGDPSVVVTSSVGLAVGNPVAGPGIADGAKITAIPDGTHVTLSAAPTSSGSIALTVWNALVVPLAVITAYLLLASAALVQARWLEMWPVAMGLYVAHFLTLYARSDGNPNSTIGQIAAQGLSLGIQTAKSVGDVSVSYQPITGLEDWGAWNLTIYGEQLAQFAKMVGSGPMLLW